MPKPLSWRCSRATPLLLWPPTACGTVSGERGWVLLGVSSAFKQEQLVPGRQLGTLTGGWTCQLGWWTQGPCLCLYCHLPHHSATPLHPCSNEDAVALVQDTVKHPAMCAQRLAVEALARGGGDNVAVTVLFLSGHGSTGVGAGGGLPNSCLKGSASSLGQPQCGCALSSACSSTACVLNAPSVRPHYLQLSVCIMPASSSTTAPRLPSGQPAPACQPTSCVTHIDAPAGSRG